MNWHILRDQPYGVDIFLLIRGSVDARRQHCPTKRLTPMGLFMDEVVRELCNFRRTIDHLPQQVYIAIREKARPQALRLGLLAGQALERSDNPATTCPEKATP